MSGPSLWRNRDYVLLWSGQSVSTIGSRVSGIVFPLLVLDLTRSAAQAGLVGALFALPYALFGLPAGAYIDRWNRKRVMLVADTARALNVASIPLALWLGHLTLGQIYLVALLEGTLHTFYDVAQSASLPQVVPAEQLPAALARSAGMVGTAQLFGPPIGGILYQAGRALPFLADALSYAASVVSLLFVKTAFQEERTAPPRHLVREILDGLTWIRRQPLIRLTGLMAATNGMVGTALSLIVIVVARQHHASASAIGIMFAIAAVGGTAGSFITARIVTWFGFRQVLIGVFWIEALLCPLYLLTSAPVLLGAITGVIWMVSGPYHLAQGTYRRALLPDELQGRVNSVFELAELGADSVAFLLTGIVLQAIGTRPAILVCIGIYAAQAVVMSLNPRVRHAPTLVQSQTT
jgi:MFS family permease